VEAIPFAAKSMSAATAETDPWRCLSVVKDNNGDLLSEDNGFFDEAFGNEWEIVR
jgi:hypothetical protein